MQNVGLDEAQSEIKIAGRNISNLRCAGGTTLRVESKGEKQKVCLRQIERSGNNCP